MKKYFLIAILLIPGCNIIGTEGYRLKKIFTEAENDKIHFMSDHINIDNAEVCILGPYGSFLSKKDSPPGKEEKIEKINRDIKKYGLYAGEGSWYFILWREDYFKYYKMSINSPLDITYFLSPHADFDKVFSNLKFTPSGCTDIKKSAFIKHKVKYVYKNKIRNHTYIIFGGTK